MLNFKHSGKHYDFGLNYGRALKNYNIDLSKYLNLSEEKKEFGKDCLKICKDYFIEVYNEIKGISEGAEVNFDDLTSFLFSMYSFRTEIGCSVIAVKSENGVIFARNADMFKVLKGSCQSSIYEPENGYRFIGNSVSMVEIEDGVNEHDLAVGLTMVAIKERVPGLNVGFLVRYILEKCKNVKEALNVVKEFPLSSPGTITIADKETIVTLELTPSKRTVIYPSDSNDYVIAVNHFISEDMKKYEIKDAFRSNERYENITKALKDNKSLYSCEYIKDILSGKYGFICDYNDPTGFDTLWSVLYDLNKSDYFIADGNPKDTEYKKIKF